MYNKKRMSKDKTIIMMSVVSVMAISALATGAFVWDTQTKKDNNMQIAELDETENTERQNVNAAINKETTSAKEITSIKTSENKTENENTSISTNHNNSDENSKEVSNNSSTEETTSNTSKEQDSISAMQENITDDDSAEVAVNGANGLQFQKSSSLIWPVETNDIIIEFSMDKTTYFATLDMYKTSDAVCIRSDVNSPVYSSCEGMVKEIGYHEEIGHFVSLDLGNNYELTYGQLKDLQIEKGDLIAEGDLIGYISEPTKYYNVEGSNLYLKLTEDGTPIDPLDFLDFE